MLGFQELRPRLTSFFRALVFFSSRQASSSSSWSSASDGHDVFPHALSAYYVLYVHHNTLAVELNHHSSENKQMYGFVKGERSDDVCGIVLTMYLSPKTCILLISNL